MPRGRARAVYRFPEETSKQIAHVSKMRRQRCAASCYLDLVCGVIVSCFRESRPLVFQSSLVGGKRKRFGAWVRVEVVRKFARNVNEQLREDDGVQV